MTPEQLAVRDFNRILGRVVNDKPTMLDADEAMLCWALIYEENHELFQAMAQKDFVGIVDALGDLLYVVYAAGAGYGVDLEPIFHEIHKSNLTKLGDDGKVIFREDGKVLKSKNYQPPDLERILVEQSN